MNTREKILIKVVGLGVNPGCIHVFAVAAEDLVNQGISIDEAVDKSVANETGPAFFNANSFSNRENLLLEFVGEFGITDEDKLELLIDNALSLVDGGLTTGQAAFEAYQEDISLTLELEDSLN
jgi:hypothetical protein